MRRFVKRLQMAHVEPFLDDQLPEALEKSPRIARPHHQRALVAIEADDLFPFQQAAGQPRGAGADDADRQRLIVEQILPIAKIGEQTVRLAEELSEEEKKELYESVKRTYDEQTDPRYGAARLWIDKIIDPIETREAITQALEAAALNPEVSEFKVGVLQT